LAHGALFCRPLFQGKGSQGLVNDGLGRDFFNAFEESVIQSESRDFFKSRGETWPVGGLTANQGSICIEYDHILNRQTNRVDPRDIRPGINDLTAQGGPQLSNAPNHEADRTSTTPYISTPNMDWGDCPRGNGDKPVASSRSQGISYALIYAYYAYEDSSGFLY
jgi:hypothetical protein